VAIAQGEALDYATLMSEYPPHDIWPPSVIFDSESKIIRCTPCGWGTPPQWSLTGPNVYTLKGVCGDGAKIGDAVVTPTRVGFTYILVESDGMISEDIHIYHASYFAIIEANGDCGNVYRRIRIESPYDNRPLGSNADAFHSTGCRKGPVLEDSYIRNTDDDFMNIHNTIQFFLAPGGSHSALIVDSHLNLGTPNSIYGTFQTFNRVLPGDKLAFFPLNGAKSSDQAFLGTVTELGQLHGDSVNSLVTKTYNLANSLAKGCPLDACMDGLKPWAGFQVYNVTFSESFPDLEAPYVVSVTTISNVGAIVRNNDFYGTSASLARVKSPGSTFTGNVLGHSCRQNFEVSRGWTWSGGGEREKEDKVRVGRKVGKAWTWGWRGRRCGGAEGWRGTGAMPMRGQGREK
jgi:hypothetical protein